MKPHDDFRNGDGGGSDSESGSEGEAEVWVEDTGAPARALAALNSLRKSRQHYDVVLLAAGGAEVAAHRALLAAASPYLLHALAPAANAAAAPVLRVADVDADALRELVDYVYTGRLLARDAAAARKQYRAAWRLRLEAPRAAIAERLMRRLDLSDCLETRALPDLPSARAKELDTFIAEHFDELCDSGAMAALPLVRIELMRASSADGGEEAPVAVAEAALAWLRDRAHGTVEELCSRSHLVYVDAVGSLRDCGELPEARGDAPELQEYRAAAAARARTPAPPVGARRTPAELELDLGARTPRAADAVLAAAGAGNGSNGGVANTCRVTRALLSLRGRLVAARVAWRDAGSVAVGGPLGGAAGGYRRAALAIGRCAHGGAVLNDRLVICGGYDRARVLKACEAYDPVGNEWSPLPDMKTARARFPAARLADSIYVFGGSDGHNELDSVDAFTGTAWVAKPKLPLALSHAAAATDGSGSVYIIGGWAGGRSLRSVYKYTAADDKWTEGPPLNAGRSQCAGVVWEGGVWALGGCDAWHCLSTTERLDIYSHTHTAEAWRPAPAFPTARRSVGGAVWRRRLIAAGGSDGAASLSRVDWLSPGASNNSSWTPAPSLRTARAGLTLHELHDALYAVGGFDGKEFLSCVECLYEPDGEWTVLCEAPPPRAPPALLPNIEGLNTGYSQGSNSGTKIPDGANCGKEIPDAANGVQAKSNGSNCEEEGSNYGSAKKEEQTQ